MKYNRIIGQHNYIVYNNNCSISKILLYVLHILEALGMLRNCWLVLVLKLFSQIDSRSSEDCWGDLKFFQEISKFVIILVIASILR